jgi:preprotein translocase subunit SecE
VTQTSTDDASTPRRSGSTSARAGKRIGLALFIRQVIAELRKVVRPTRNELVTYTTVVMVFVVVVMAFVSALDIGLGKLVLLVFGGG